MANYGLFLSELEVELFYSGVLFFLLSFMETTGEHISTSVMFQRTHARLWLLSSSWTVKSLVSSWYVSGKTRALDWISLVVCRGEKECAQLGYLLTDSTDIVTFWSGFKTEEQSAFFLFNHANLILHSALFFFHDERLCHLPSCPVTLNHLITVDKAVFGGSYSHMFTLHLYACRDGSCAIRGSSGVFFLWILVVQFMYTDRICVVTPSYVEGDEMGSCWCNIAFALRLK